MTHLFRRRLEEALRLLGADAATADALTRADAIWLARVLPDGNPSAAARGAAIEANGSRLVTSSANVEGAAGRTIPVTGTAPTPAGDSNKPDADTTALFVQQTGADGELQLHARRVPVPAADALPGRANFERALRPFLRRRPSRVRRIVDAEATAEASAQASAEALLVAMPGERALPALVPVLRPAPERWFDMVLLAEQDDTMRVFEDTLKELRQLLARHGAFRRVGLWRWSVLGGTLQVHTASGMPSAPRAMLQGQHPQLIWVLTHGASSKWNESPLSDFVRGLAAHATVAVVQLLPESAWGATVLGESRERVRSRERAAANRQLLRLDPWTATWTREGALNVVPMLSLQPDSVGRWAEFVMSPRALEHAAVAFNARVEASAEGELAVHPSAAAGDAEARTRERVLSFRAIASPQAFALLRQLSGAWITLPVMRLLLQSMPGPRALTPIAEVLLSGLLQRTSKADARTEELTFDFAPEVREWLSGSLSGEERRALDKAMADSKEAIRQFLESKLNRTLMSFNAMLLDPEGTELLPASARSFVELSRKLRSLRGSLPVTPPTMVKAEVTVQPHRRTVRKLRILHLSDLHIGRDRSTGAWRERPFMGKAWRENLQQIFEQGVIDLVCLTGDVAHSGRAEEYIQAKDFIVELMSMLQLSMVRFFVVPGNHDIDRGVANDARSVLSHTPVLRDLDSREFKQVLQRQNAFRDWTASLGRQQDPKTVGYRETVDLGSDASISIVGLDSAWLSDDETHAVPPRVGESQLSRLLTTQSPKAWSIALMHHPLRFLGDGKSVERSLVQAGTTLLLHGHRHGQHELSWAKTPRGIQVSSTRTLYADDPLQVGFHVLEVELHPPFAENPGRVQLVRMTSHTWSASGLWRDAEAISVEGVVSVEPAQLTAAVRLNPEILEPEQTLFVGRRHELEQMLRVLRPPSGTQSQPVAVLGAPGIGKTALTRAFLIQHWEPGMGSEAAAAASHLRFNLSELAADSFSAATLAQMVTVGLGISGRPVSVPDAMVWELLRRELERLPRLLLFDDVDTELLVIAVTEFAARLPGWPIIATSRLQSFGNRWFTIALTPLSLREACELLWAEVASNGTRATLPDSLAEALASLAGCMPYKLTEVARRLAQGVTAEQLIKELDAGPATTSPSMDPDAFEKELNTDEQVDARRTPEKPEKAKSQSAKKPIVFISAVGGEFGSFTKLLRQRLQSWGFEVFTQRSFGSAAVATLIQVDDLICLCDIVVYLAGDACGADARPSSEKALIERYPDLATRLPAIREHLSGGGRPLTYQQWEAWLAHYHGKRLIVATPSAAFKQGLIPATDESQKRRQQQHLWMLRRDARVHMELLFDGPDDIQMGLLSSDFAEGADAITAPASESASEASTTSRSATDPARVESDRGESDLAKPKGVDLPPSSDTVGLPATTGRHTDGRVLKIAFTSSMSFTVSAQQPVWDQIAAQRPDRLVLLGDSVYIDAPPYPIGITHPKQMETVDFLQHVLARWRTQLDQPQFRALVKAVPTDAIWDARDFLWDDCSVEGVIEKRVYKESIRISRALFNAFRRTLDERLAPGSFPSAYNDASINQLNEPPPGYRHRALAADLHLHLTDGRSWRIRKELLGADQRSQIEAKLAAAPSAVHLIASGSVVQADDDERWALFDDHAWLLGLVRHYKILVLSGDTQSNRFQSTNLGNGRWLHEATASGAAIRKLVTVGSKCENYGLLDISVGRLLLNFYRSGEADSKVGAHIIDRASWLPGPAA